MKIKGVSKYGIKLEDYSDYDAYRKACKLLAIKAFLKTVKGKLVTSNYSKSAKGKLKSLKQRLNGNAFKNQKKYYNTKKGKITSRFNDANRRSAKLKRTPAWADLKAIKQFYADCPKGYQVDHIVPLRGVNVSGFHVLNNLQYLTKSENCKKHNKYVI